MTPREIAEYYIRPIDPNKFPDTKGITPEEIEEHIDRLAKAIENLCKKVYNKGYEEGQADLNEIINLGDTP